MDCKCDVNLPEPLTCLLNARAMSIVGSATAGD